MIASPELSLLIALQIPAPIRITAANKALTRNANTLYSTPLSPKIAILNRIRTQRTAGRSNKVEFTLDFSANKSLFLSFSPK